MKNFYIIDDEQGEFISARGGSKGRITFRNENNGATYPRYYFDQDYTFAYEV